MTAEVIPIRRVRAFRDYEAARNSLQWNAWHRRRIELFAQLEQAAHNLNLEDGIHWLTRLEAHQADRPPGFPEGAA